MNAALLTTVFFSIFITIECSDNMCHYQSNWDECKGETDANTVCKHWEGSVGDPEMATVTVIDANKGNFTKRVLNCTKFYALSYDDQFEYIQLFEVNNETGRVNCGTGKNKAIIPESE